MICPYCFHNILKGFAPHVAACQATHEARAAEAERLRRVHAHRLPLGPGAQPLIDVDLDAILPRGGPTIRS